MSKLSERPAPRDVDIDINRMRADKINELRLIMRDLDDLDAVERVLNGQTHHIAVAAAAALVVQRNGANGHGRLLHAAQAAIEQHEEHAPGKKKRKKHSTAIRIDELKERIVDVLTIARKRGPLQMGDIMDAVKTGFPGPAAAHSTFNRAMLLLRQDKAVTILAPKGSRWPVYQLYDDAQGRAARPAKRRAAKHRNRPHMENGVSAGVVRVLADGNPDGMTIPEITAALESDGKTEFLPQHPHNSQVSWALKGHRDHHRLKSVEKGGVRIHKLLRPAISVRKG